MVYEPGAGRESRSYGGWKFAAMVAGVVLVMYAMVSFGHGEPDVSSYGETADRFGITTEYYPEEEDSVAAEESAEGDFYDMAYADCDEAREYGHTPVHEDEVGYGPHLDRDGDGVGCEPWYGP